MFRHGTDYFAERNNCLTLVYVKTLLVWDCRVIYIQLLSYISILYTLYSMQILMVSVLTDKLYSVKLCHGAIRNTEPARSILSPLYCHRLLTLKLVGVNSLLAMTLVG